MILNLADIEPLLQRSGLRPTRHRVALARLLFDREATRHVTAEQLFAEAKAAHIQLSLATVYNVINQFLNAGLLRQVMLTPGVVHVDSNISSHHHIINSDRGTVRCFDAKDIGFSRLPVLADDEIIDHIEVIIRTRAKNPL
jgi:Fur family transcriptional regulator, iron response regulator